MENPVPSVYTVEGVVDPMKPECQNFDLQAAQERLSKFGFCSVPIDQPKAVVDEFAAQHSATVTKGFFNWMVKLSSEPDPKDREDKWELLRQENLKRRLTLAVRRKNKGQ